MPMDIHMFWMALFASSIGKTIMVTIEVSYLSGSIQRRLEASLLLGSSVPLRLRILEA